MADVDGDGDADAYDLDAIYTLYRSNTVISNTSYNADADIDHDGDIDSADYDLAANEGTHPALAKGALSNVGNVFGFSGYIMNSEASGGGGGVYTIRFRHYDTGLGRWLQRDPAGYVDGMSLYEYVRGGPLQALDPFGLVFGGRTLRDDASLQDVHELDTVREGLREGADWARPLVIGLGVGLIVVPGVVVALLTPGPGDDAIIISSLLEVLRKNALNVPSWVRDARTLIAWLKELSKDGVQLNQAQLEALLKLFDKFGVKYRIDPGHPNTPWPMPHINVGNKGQVHVPLQQAYPIPAPYNQHCHPRYPGSL